MCLQLPVPFIAYENQSSSLSNACDLHIALRDIALIVVAHAGHHFPYQAKILDHGGDFGDVRSRQTQGCHFVKTAEDSREWDGSWRRSAQRWRFI